MFSNRLQQPSSAISEDKMEEIIDAILQGKYSSACLLLLEETGHDPLHYIPYRTYNRLQNQRQQEISARNRAVSLAKPTVTPLRAQMADLDYIELLPEQGPTAKGGSVYWLETAHKSCHFGISNRSQTDTLNAVYLPKPCLENNLWKSTILTT
jgi:hypothetical protein